MSHALRQAVGFYRIRLRAYWDAMSIRDGYLEAKSIIGEIVKKQMRK